MPMSLEYCREAVANWKRLELTVMDGDQYRLVSPYDSNHAAIEYVDKTGNSAVVFAYNLSPRFGEKLSKVKFSGLDPDKSYSVEEINLMPGTGSKFSWNGRWFSGDYLMKVGLDLFSHEHNSSAVVELKAI